MKKLICKIFGHDFPPDYMARQNDMPESVGRFTLAVKCEIDCKRCGFTKIFYGKWD